MEEVRTFSWTISPLMPTVDHAPLLAVGGGGDALHIALAGQGDDHVLLGDQVMFKTLLWNINFLKILKLQ